MKPSVFHKTAVDSKLRVAVESLSLNIFKGHTMALLFPKKETLGLYWHLLQRWLSSVELQPVLLLSFSCYLLYTSYDEKNNHMVSKFVKKLLSCVQLLVTTLWKEIHFENTCLRLQQTQFLNSHFFVWNFGF